MSRRQGVRDARRGRAPGPEGGNQAWRTVRWLRGLATTSNRSRPRPSENAAA